MGFRETSLISRDNAGNVSRMALPTGPVTLTVAQIEDLNKKLSDMRHEVNNKLTLIAGGIDVIRLKPELTERWLTMMAQQPQQIGAEMTRFSREMEAVLGITSS